MKKIIKIFTLFLILFITLGCSKKTNEEYITEEVNLQLGQMTLRQKIAQMLIVYNKTKDIDEEYLKEIEEHQIGGFIIFDDNIKNFEETKKFIHSIYEKVEIPMFIAVDQEGGKVQRLLSVKDKKPTKIPDMKTVGDKNDLNLSYAIGTIIGEESRSLGINMVFAPVLDVGNYKTSPLAKRLFSNKPNIVSANGIKVAEGIKDSGIIPVYKHFPGIANTKVDSHKDLPIIKKTLDELHKEELIPFINAIQSKDAKAEIIMVGHANYPNITKDNLPSSLSSKIIKDLLRNDLGFNGVVITDAINMDALDKKYSEEEIFELGINATVDIFLMPSGIKTSIDKIERLVNEGKIKEERINESVKRILTLKNKYLDNFTTIDELYFGSLEHKAIIENVNK